MIGESFILSALLFTIGIFGVLINRKNLITILVSIEIIFLSANINLVAGASLYGITGYIFAMFSLTIAAAEAAIGLAILIVYFRNANSIEISDIHRLKG